MRKLLPDFTVLNGDDYFEPVKNRIVWGVFNGKRFKQDVLEPLKRGNTLIYRPYNWQNEPHISERPIRITTGLCLERCFSFALDLDWDLKLWVETPKEVCLERGVARASVPRERALVAWRDIWQPTEDAYIQDFNPVSKADLVIDGTKPFEEQMA